jgi:hypothetical protein
MGDGASFAAGGSTSQGETDSVDGDPPLPSGDGFSDGLNCFPRCASNATDPDPMQDGATDGFGFENGESCIVVGSPRALSSAPCVPQPPEVVDIPAGDGFFLDGQCFAPCVTGGEVDARGFGFEQGRSCIQPASDAADGTVPCVPPPPDLTNICPALVCPVVDGVEIECGCGTIPDFGERKLEIFAAGGDQRFLASAMIETRNMTTDYPFGDVNPGPDGMTGTGDDTPKTGGAANFGIAKQNWTMIRQCHPAYAGLNDAAFQRGAELNMSLTLDIEVYNECRAFFGDRWFAGHRNGAAGLNNSNTLDIRRFQAGTEWVRQMLDGHLEDDIQFFVVIEAI